MSEFDLRIEDNSVEIGDLEDKVSAFILGDGSIVDVQKSKSLSKKKNNKTKRV